MIKLFIHRLLVYLATGVTFPLLMLSLDFFEDKNGIKPLLLWTILISSFICFLWIIKRGKKENVVIFILTRSFFAFFSVLFFLLLFAFIHLFYFGIDGWRDDVVASPLVTGLFFASVQKCGKNDKWGTTIGTKDINNSERYHTVTIKSLSRNNSCMNFWFLSEEMGGTNKTI